MKRSDPTDVGVVISLLSRKGKWSSDSRFGCFKGVATHFHRDCNASKHMGKQSYGKGKQSKSRSKSEPLISGKGKDKVNQGKTKGLSRGTKSENKSAKGLCEGKTLEIEQVDTAVLSWIHEEWSQDERNEDWSFDEWNDDRNCVGWREDCEQTQVTLARSFSLESSGWVKTNLDTRAVGNTLPSNFNPEGIGDGHFHDWIPDGEAWQFQGYDEKWFSQISGWKTHGCIRGVEQQRISLCISTSIKSCGDRMQRTTRLLCETQWWLHDADSQQNWSGNENSF